MNGRAGPPGAAAARGPSQRLRDIYWLTPLLLTGVQAWISVAAMHQIRYEELAESVRNVFWLDHRQVYDGISSNVGWYGTLLLVYKIFGFSLVAAKWVKLALHFISLLCIASLLRRVMSLQLAIVPLLLIGLSPTWLYFDSLQASFGLDLSYASICLWLLLSVRPERSGIMESGKIFLAGIVAMVAAMSYPSFLSYLPSLIVIACWWCRRGRETGSSGGRARTRYVLSACAGFLLPLVVALGFVASRAFLIYDPDTHAGLFRGGGGTAVLDPSAIAHAISAVLGDLFVRGRTYYFELTRPEFSGWLGIAGVCAVGAAAIYFARAARVNRSLAAATVMLVLLAFLLPSLSTGGLPGLRRCTGVLAAYFVAFTWVWYSAVAAKVGSALMRRGAVAACAILLVTTAAKLPSLRADVGGDSGWRNTDWFATAATPTESLEVAMSQVQNGQRLACPLDAENQIIPCRYQEIYAAIAGYRAWNGLAPLNLAAVDWRTGGDITLTMSLWMDHYYPH